VPSSSTKLACSCACRKGLKARFAGKVPGKVRRGGVQERFAEKQQSRGGGVEGSPLNAVQSSTSLGIKHAYNAGGPTKWPIELLVLFGCCSVRPLLSCMACSD
jgi:hypothetical protein